MPPCRLRTKPQRLFLWLLGGSVVLMAASHLHWLRPILELPAKTFGEQQPAGGAPGGWRYIKNRHGHRWQRALVADSLKPARERLPKHLFMGPNHAAAVGPRWQTVVEDVLWVYSAYLDTRPQPPIVKIFGMMQQNLIGQSAFECKYSAQNTSWQGFNQTTKGRSTNLDGFHINTKMGSVTIHCELPSGSSWSLWRSIRTVSVQLVGSNEHKNKNTSVEVQLIERLENDTTNSRVNFTVCTSPIFFNYSDVGEFVEAIEVGQMFGASKFVIYDLTIGPALRPYVDYYAQRGTVELRSWRLPLYDELRPKSIHKVIHYFGQVIAFNDCVYRNMFRSEFVAVIDLDELIVPLKASDWSGMISNLGPSSGYDFNCVFFRKDWPADEKFVNSTNGIVKKLNLRTLLKTKRETKEWQHGSRSKQMVRPEIVEEYHIHFVSKFFMDSPASQVLNVRSEEALLYHYRYWDDKQGPWLVERRMHAFSSEITERVANVYNTVRNGG